MATVVVEAIVLFSEHDQTTPLELWRRPQQLQEKSSVTGPAKSDLEENKGSRPLRRRERVMDDDHKVLTPALSQKGVVFKKGSGRTSRSRSRMEGQAAPRRSVANLSQTVQQLLSTTKETEALQVYVRKSDQPCSDEDSDQKGQRPEQKKPALSATQRGRPKERRGVSLVLDHREIVKKVQEKRRLPGPPPMSKSTSISSARSSSPSKSGPPSRIHSASRRGSRRIRRVREELYTDKDRAAAVNLGSKDIKQDLSVKKKQERKMLFEIPDQFDSDVFVLQADREIKRDLLDLGLSTLNKALELEPGNTRALVARSKCYLQLGDVHSALKDVESALREDSVNIMGILQKAETLYQMSMFEHALVHFHRGYRIRPDIADFRVGVQKAQEAIQNSVCHKGATRLCTDLQGLEKLMREMDERELQQLQAAKVTRKGGAAQAKTTTTGPSPIEMARKKRKPVDGRRISKELLGPLHHDKVFLERLEHRKELVVSGGKTNTSLQVTVRDAINYLNTREDFWRQHKPLYCRAVEKNISAKVRERAESDERKTADEKQRMMMDLARKVLKRGKEDVEYSLISKTPDECLLVCNRALKAMVGVKESPAKKEVVAFIVNVRGQCLLGMNKGEAACNAFLKELNYADELESDEIRQRARDWLGKAYVKAGQYNNAVQVWEARLPLTTDPMERVWLCHEIGRCYLEMDKLDEANYYAEMCTNTADGLEKSGGTWKFNALVLRTQANIKLGNLEEAMNCLQLAESTPTEDTPTGKETQKIMKQTKKYIQKSEGAE